MERLRSFTNGLKPNILERIGQVLPQVHKIDHFVTWVLQPVGPQKGSTVGAYSGSLAKVTTWGMFRRKWVLFRPQLLQNTVKLQSAP